MAPDIQFVMRGFPTEDGAVAFPPEPDPQQRVLRALERGVGTLQAYLDYENDARFAGRSWQHRVRFHFLLGKFACKQESFEQAIHQLRKCIIAAEATPVEHDAIFVINVYRELGLAETHFDNYTQAIEAYTTVIDTIQRIRDRDPRTFVEGDIDCLLCSLYYMRGKEKTFAGVDFPGAFVDLMAASELCETWEQRHHSDGVMNINDAPQNAVNWLMSRLFVAWMVVLSIGYRVRVQADEDLGADTLHALSWGIAVVHDYGQDAGYSSMWYFSFSMTVAWLLSFAGQIESLHREVRQMSFTTSTKLLIEAGKELNGRDWLETETLLYELITYQNEFGKAQLDGGISWESGLDLLRKTLLLLEQVRKLQRERSALELQVFITMFLGDLYLVLNDLRGNNFATQARTAYLEAQALIANHHKFLPVLKLIVDRWLKKFGEPRQ